MNNYEACWEVVKQRDIWDDVDATIHACLDALGIDPNDEHEPPRELIVRIEQP